MPRSGLSWPGSGSGFAISTTCTGFGGVPLQKGRLLIVVADLRRLEGCAAGERGGRKYNESEGPGLHQPSSFDQLMARTNTPRGFLRSRSASCGVSSTMVTIAVHRSVAARLAFS